MRSAISVVLASMLAGRAIAAAQPLRALENAIYENPHFVIGVNNATGTVSGYFAALRTEPGRTDACKLVFAGKLGVGAAKVAVVEVGDGESSRAATVAEISESAANFEISFDEKKLPGDCGWILDFIGSPAVKKSGERFSIALTNGRPGDWIGIAVIDASRSYFYDKPQEGSSRKAYLVKGDVVKVYEERRGWYFVRYRQREKETNGWIRVGDTVPIRK